MRGRGMMGSLLAMGALLATASLNAKASMRSLYYKDGYVPRKKRKATKRYPQMITSTDAEIEAHNAACNTRQVRRAGR